MNDRGTGRTTGQMLRLPAGSIYVVMHDAERRHCWDLLAARELPRDHLRIVTVVEVMQGRLSGLPRDTMMDVDHHVLEEPLREEARAHLDEWRYRFKFPETLLGRASVAHATENPSHGRHGPA